MNTKNNQRFQDTEHAIQQTLLKLAQTTDIRKVTIRAICEGAGINRSTFYAHYLDINDLVDQMGKQMIYDIGLLMQNKERPLDLFMSRAALVELIQYVQEHRDFFSIYFGAYGAAAEMQFALLWEPEVKPYMQSLGMANEVTMWYHFAFFRAGFIAVLHQWIISGCHEPAGQIADTLLYHSPRSFM